MERNKQIRYFELDPVSVRYFCLNDIKKAENLGLKSSAEWNAMTKILKKELRQFNKGEVTLDKFFIFPNGLWFIHWTVAEYIRDCYKEGKKSKKADLEDIFSLMDYYPSTNDREIWDKHFLRIESPIFPPRGHP